MKDPTLAAEVMVEELLHGGLEGLADTQLAVSRNHAGKVDLKYPGERVAQGLLMHLGRMLLRVDQEERQAVLVVPDHHIADCAVDLDIDLDARGLKGGLVGDQDAFPGGAALVRRELHSFAVGGECYRQALARQLLRHGGHRDVEGVGAVARHLSIVPAGVVAEVRHLVIALVGDQGQPAGGADAAAGGAAEHLLGADHGLVLEAQGKGDTKHAAAHRRVFPGSGRVHDLQLLGARLLRPDLGLVGTAPVDAARAALVHDRMVAQAGLLWRRVPALRYW